MGSFLLFIISNFFKGIPKWASYAEAKFILTSVSLLFYYHVMWVLVTGMTLFHVLLWPCVGCLIILCSCETSLCQLARFLLSLTPLRRSFTYCSSFYFLNL